MALIPMLPETPVSHATATNNNRGQLGHSSLLCKGQEACHQSRVYCTTSLPLAQWTTSIQHARRSRCGLRCETGERGPTCDNLDGVAEVLAVQLPHEHELALDQAQDVLLRVLVRGHGQQLAVQAHCGSMHKVPDQALCSLTAEVNSLAGRPDDCTAQASLILGRRNGSLLGHLLLRARGLADSQALTGPDIGHQLHAEGM